LFLEQLGTLQGRFNRALHADSRVALALATMGDGMSLALKL